MPFSHHSHSGEFCKHANGTLEQVIQEAIRQNFKTYCLTEHVPRYRVQDLYPEEVNQRNFPAMQIACLPVVSVVTATVDSD